MGWATKTPENGRRSSFFKMQSRKRSDASLDVDPSNGEFATAVLAAAFAIHSLEEAKTPQHKNHEKTTVQQPGGTNQVTRRPSNKKYKTAGEASMGKSTVKNHEGIGSRSFSVRPTPAAGVWEKVQRHEKLKSVLAWANEKKKKKKEKEAIYRKL